MTSSASFENVVEIEHEDYSLELVVSQKMTDYCNLFPMEYIGFTLPPPPFEYQHHKHYILKKVVIRKQTKALKINF